MLLNLTKNIENTQLPELICLKSKTYQADTEQTKLRQTTVDPKKIELYNILSPKKIPQFYEVSGSTNKFQKSRSFKRRIMGQLSGCKINPNYLSQKKSFK